MANDKQTPESLLAMASIWRKSRIMHMAGLAGTLNRGLKFLKCKIVFNRAALRFRRCPCSKKEFCNIKRSSECAVRLAKCN